MDFRHQVIDTNLDKLDTMEMDDDDLMFTDNVYDDDFGDEDEELFGPGKGKKEFEDDDFDEEFEGEDDEDDLFGDDEDDFDEDWDDDVDEEDVEEDEDDDF